MNRREFIFGTIACAMMPCSKGNDNHIVALSNIEVNKINTDITKFNDIVKCSKGIVYFAEKYITVYTTRKGHFNVELKDWQKKYLMHLASGKDAVLDAYRQSRKTTTNLIYALWKTLFTPHQKITFVTCNKRMSESIFDVVKTMFAGLPDWMKSRDYASEYYMHNAKHIMLKNRSELVVTYANADFCGYMPGSTLILDECAFFTNKQNTNIANILPAFTKGKNHQFIIASTPSSMNNIFSNAIRYMKEHGKTSDIFKIVKS